jgi:hypothetical protein
MCTKCGDTSCGGKCTKKCIKVYRPTVWRDGQTGIQGADGNDGVGIVNIVDNGDGTFTIFLSDGSNYTINLPAATGKYVVAINSVSGNDSEWELEYDDASTLVIASPYYIINAGTGEKLIFGEAGNPTQIRSLEEEDNNSKILLTTNADEIDFKVKQYGIRTALDFQDNSGSTSWFTHQTPRFQNNSGGVQVVTKSGGGQTITNPITEEFDLNLQVIDSYKSILYFRIKESFDLTYNDLSFTQALNRRFHFVFPLLLGSGTPSIPNGSYWKQLTNDYFNGNHNTFIYDIYVNGQDVETNKLRRFAERKVGEVYYQKTDGTAEPGSGWIGGGAVGPRIVFRYPYVEGLTNPAGGDDVTERLTFEATGSIIVPTQETISHTNFLSTVANQQQNH